MNIKEQVLSIEQVRELQELGFDVEKYASMCWLEQTPFIPIEQPKEYGLEILTDSLMGNRGNLDAFPTLTIGDIIDILPKEIKGIKSINAEWEIIPIYSLDIIPSSMNRYFVDYVHSSGAYYLNEITKTTLIDALFEMLKWCIKQKHIEL